MNLAAVREGYRRRLRNGDIVYFVEGESILGLGQLIVKKASVTSVELADGGERYYPVVTLWETVDSNPNEAGVSVLKSPRELFTPKEVVRALVNDGGPLGVDERPIDILLTETLTNQELAAVLGGIVIARLAQDELRNPRNPEY